MAALTEDIKALQAKLEGLREAGEADRATVQTLRDELAALKSEREKKIEEAKEAGVFW